MGVQGTYCTVCGGPVNDDQYVDEADPVRFTFQPQHQWLLKVVVLQGKKPRFGTVEDAEFVDAKGAREYVGDGLGGGDFLTVHEACWNLAGQPKSENKLPVDPLETPNVPDQYGALWSDPWAEIRPYQGQLFNFKALPHDALWLLEDPTSDTGSRNRERILKRLVFVPEVVNGVDVEKVKRQRQEILDGPWGSTKSDSLTSEYRSDVPSTISALFPRQVRIRKPYPPTASGLPDQVFDAFMNDFLATLRDSVEASGLGVVISMTKTANTCTYVLATADLDKFMTRLRKLAELDMPMVATIDSEL